MQTKFRKEIVKPAQSNGKYGGKKYFNFLSVSVLVCIDKDISGGVYIVFYKSALLA